MAASAPATPQILSVPDPQQAPETPDARVKDSTDRLASHILLFSFAAAVVLAIGGFVVVTIYLFIYLSHAFKAFDPDSIARFASMDVNKMQPILLARAGLWKFILQSCGIISGVAFGFLGFGLFLLGAKGDMDASFANSEHKVQLSRMAPGSFVILIAALLIGICSINKVELSFTPVETTTVTETSPAQGSSANGPAAKTKPLESVGAERDTTYPMPINPETAGSANPPKAGQKSLPAAHQRDKR